MKTRSPEINAAAAASDASPIDIEKLLYSAQIISGSFDTLDEGLRSRVTKFVTWVNEQPPMNPIRKEEVELQIRKLLVTRLRLAADRKRLPAIAQEKVAKPIFVIGFARTGTTLLHSLLAEDPKAMAPKWWHTHDPSPPPGEVAVTDERIEYTGKDLDHMLDLCPGLLTMHPYWDKRGHCLIEDEEIFTLDFQNAYPSLLYKLPALAMILDASNIGEAYRFEKEFLQHLQWGSDAGNHWVMKGIYHQFVLDELFEAFPDAVCIWPHRDPVEVHPSTMAITAVLYGGITNWEMDFKALGPMFVNSIADSVAAAIENPLVDDPRIFHVDFREMTKDPIDMIRRAYAYWGREFTPEFETRMKAWLADPSNASERYGRYKYTMEPYGLSREMIETAFEGYCKRFKLGKFA